MLTVSRHVLLVLSGIGAPTSTVIHSAIHSPSEEYSSAFSTLMASTFIRLGKSKLALWISALSLHQRWTGSIERACT
ncbi:hypothetical protein J008_07075 [Cryptococcus neoformans]|nr:hypothetical protein C362_07045 [Cryptococcus neoformans var. grubii Bt1]OXC64502.1 hypothetical protein AYX13_06127 [Cryptococcus neoformans var. grubii]OXG09733.1 hypothetical protein C367_07043 [Cryptococcus neoformans var. grubii Ze90-1]OXH20830.1 hypothetical protein J008_07075 [Cryptococcus neoformans var. grubii]